jgi:predicted anti-sigma-YlaC factor YlaD
MDCSEARKLITLKAGGDLEPGEAAELDTHLDTCEGCRALLAAYSADRGLLGSLREQGPEPPSHDEFWASLKTKLEPEVRKRRVHRVTLKVLRVVTAAAVLLIAVTFLVHIGYESPEIIAPPPGGGRPPVETTNTVGSAREEVTVEKDQPGLELEECELLADSNPQYDF